MGKHFVLNRFKQGGKQMDKSNHLGIPMRFQEKDKISNKSIMERFKNRKNINFENIHIRIALSALILAFIVLLGTAAYKTHMMNTLAFDVYIGQAKIGTARDKDEILNTVENIKYELSKTYDMEIVLTNELNFEETHVKDELLTPIEDFKGAIQSKLGFMVYGHVLSADGKDLGALKSKEDIDLVLEKIKEPFKLSLQEGEVLKDIRILEEISIEKKEVPLNTIKDLDGFHNHLLTGSEEIKIHKVEVGESFWTIAAIYGMTVEDLIAANPDKNPEIVQIGDEIKLVLAKPVLTVETVTERQYDKIVKYETKTEYDDNMYDIYQETKQAGENGSSTVLESKIRQNGLIVEEKILSETITKEPISEVILKGAKETPKTMATGTFLRPTRGRVSSPYGMRNGRMHKGLDIASGTGTSIKAADGGKVVYVGYRGAYGKLVEIDHENGYKTRYAHNSSISVKVGDRVYKGQEISKMGSTGRSTGSHLHFEVIKSGSNQNPSKYVN